ncbi:hypothetical protein EI545_11735 [Tabrizicola piscis]|uniref:Flagellar export protein FliJ n=1 Tax=Tabrizicola piscis TaxID=2494374 RepID=A0A3S8U796_9RHOB|nr:hypothetical protein [Tabrizicola piscis]AZL59453.1 hypothetical protein EI545_11735 [Tabrizicola piscis]
MTRRTETTKVITLADLLLRHHLGQMRQAAERLDRSRAQMAAIDKAADPADLPEVVAARVDCDYRRWADARKSELNLVLARQTAEVLAARAEAEVAFGRVQALRGIAARLHGKR